MAKVAPAEAEQAAREKAAAERAAPENEAAAKKAAEVVVAAPQQMEMIKENFGPHSALLVQQTMRGCCQECMGCEAKSEFKISPLDWSNVDGHAVNDAAVNAPKTMYALEKSGFCVRCCWRDGRGFTMPVSKGSEAGGDTIVNFEKPCGCPLNFTIPTNNGDITCPCCCMLPKIITKAADGSELGNESRYICDQNCYVPKLKYYEKGEEVYMVKPQTCCGGCCISCSCSGKGCIYIPFYFHNKDGSVVGKDGKYSDEAPQIRKVWAGWKKECCSTADTFAVSFPEGISDDRKAGLLGMTFLLDFTVFERQQEK